MQHLFRSVGFPWAVRILAFLIMILLAICAAIMRLRTQDGPRKKRFSLYVLRDKSYAAFVAGV
jgi:uncharacterized protein YxeA